MKKRIALLLAALLLISMAACGLPKPEVKNKQMAPAATEPANPEKTPQPTKEPKATETPAPTPTEAPLQEITETEAPSAAPETAAPTATPASVPAETPAQTPEIVAITPTAPTEAPAVTRSVEETYVLNTNTLKFHKPSCSSVKDIKEANRKEVTMSRDDIIAQGYQPCKKCNP